jgi:excisionase family DNA binding protein
MGIEGAAQRLGVPVRHVRRLVAERRIPFIKWGSRLHFDPSDLDDWIEAHRVASIEDL